ncbi:FixH family protein [Zoogloea sp.]|uniref:FixH family protein n=1 Tax=Zoogloea sp. TaxID=49181 RepID=UPI0025D9D03D|nr:FixH family protein [Zoogloea sp.]MCK6393769.1 FixH family protein [Zoogloea sp.]
MNMSATEAKRSPTPWYKERWTWLLMLMPATAIVAGSITLWLAIKSFDGLVTDDYYKQGLAINQTLARATTAQDMGLVARVRFSAESLSVELSAKPGVDLPGRLNATLAHPTRGGLDQQIVLERKDGAYRAAIPVALSTAHWKVLLEDESRSWRLSGTAFLPTETEIRIDSADLKPVD